MNVRSFKDLLVWQKAMDFVVACYNAIRPFPKFETYALADQLRRAVVSVPANIAEGQGRQHRLEFIQHLSIAYGSLMEVETHILIAERLGYITSGHSSELMTQSAEIGRMLNGLQKSLRTKTDH